MEYMNIDDIAKKLTTAGLSLRSTQLTMIKEAYQALHHKHVICLEAPTGTGKTISYGIAAYLAKQEQQTVVISTATIALQEQLYQQDLPLLSKVLGTEIRAALIKGRRRYICHARLYDDDVQVDIFSRNDYQQQLRQLLESNGWSGDRDQLNISITETQWQQVSTDTNGCSGKACSFFQQCAFYKARQKWQQSDFVITNHSLLLADLTLGGGALLPAMDKSIYIVDECHHFPEKALDHFAQSAPILDALEWINPLNAATIKAQNNNLITASRLKSLQDRSQQLVLALQGLQQYLEVNLSCFIEDFNRELIWRCHEDQTEIFALAEPIKHASAQLSNECALLLSEFEESLKQSAAESEKQLLLTKHIAQFGFFYNHADNLNQTFQLFCQPREPQESPLARWFMKNARGQFLCHAAPLNVSRQLKNLFWEKITAGALLCSATLRAMGDFNDFRRKCGLQNHPHLKEIALDTCFDYSKSVLFVPMMRAAPQGQEQSLHLEAVINLLPELILPSGGTLVLFTSKSAMEKTFSRMPTQLQSDILMQGNIGKPVLLAAHKNKVNGGGRSILFGLASFGEGLDLPANLCQHVIIHKLPFATPTTPVELTRNEWLTKNQRNPFELATLPAASIRLAQYVGRLIRQETDRGIVTILDKRLYSKPYGAKLLKNLPGFHQLMNCSLQTFKENQHVAYLFNTLETIGSL